MSLQTCVEQTFCETQDILKDVVNQTLLVTIDSY